MTDAGQLLLLSKDRLAQVDDRDVAQCMAWLVMDGKPVSDEQLLQWLAQQPECEQIMFQYAGSRLPLRHVQQEDISRQFGFIRKPVLAED